MTVDGHLEHTTLGGDEADVEDKPELVKDLGGHAHGTVGVVSGAAELDFDVTHGVGWYRKYSGTSHPDLDDGSIQSGRTVEADPDKRRSPLKRGSVSLWRYRMRLRSDASSRFRP